MLLSLKYRVSNAIDGRPAQKIKHICFGASWDAYSVWDTKQELGDVPS